MLKNNGNVVQIVNNRDTGRTQSFTYDELNRIVTAQSQATSGANCWGNSFAYDVWANLLSKTVTKCTAESLSVTVSTNNRITNAGFTYDAAGNVTNSGAGVMTYDAENRLTNAAGVTYTYDGDGKRVKKSNGKLYWTGMGSDPLLETDLAGNSPTEFIFFNGKRTARRDASGTIEYYFSDHLGSADVITSATGTIVEESDYYPFGGERVILGGDPNQYKFTGKERDAESGLDYFGARYYTSAVGRLLNPDPQNEGADAIDPQTWNLYTYVRNNPLRFTDPSGEAHVDQNGYIVGDKDGECQNNGKICWNQKKQLWEKPSERAPTQEERIKQLADFITEATRFHSLMDVLQGGVEGVLLAQGTWALGRGGWSAVSTQIARNSLKASIGERLVEAMFRLKGYRIVGRHVTARTTQGIRYVDYIVEKGGEFVAVEVKTGNGVRNAAQLAKDAAIETQGATIGHNGGELTNQVMKLRTIEVRPF